VPSERADLTPLAERLGHAFDDPELLRRALAHRSWCAEHPGTISNERLEFLGDAVLGWAVADLAYHRYDVPEGQLTDLRKSVVNAIALAAVAVEIGLGEHILLGRGEAAAGGADKPSILSDAFEAVLGAVYLDGGSEAAYRLVERFVVPRMPDDAAALGAMDQKTHLQELLARAGRGAPVYDVTSKGPDHAKSFRATVLVDGDVLGVGEGRSKKAAEQAAATDACAELGV
jgi:ribonuclease-3